MTVNNHILTNVPRNGKGLRADPSHSIGGGASRLSPHLTRAASLACRLDHFGDEAAETTDPGFSLRWACRRHPFDTWGSKSKAKRATARKSGSAGPKRADPFPAKPGLRFGRCRKTPFPLVRDGRRAGPSAQRGLTPLAGAVAFGGCPARSAICPPSGGNFWVSRCSKTPIKIIDIGAEKITTRISGLPGGGETP